MLLGSYTTPYSRHIDRESFIIKAWSDSELFVVLYL